jgi:hypothetical protein
MANENDSEKVVKNANEVVKPEVESNQDGDDDDDFINSLLEGADTEEESEVKEAEQRVKNKNAEEARKRRLAETKGKVETKVVEEETEQQVEPQPEVKPEQKTEVEAPKPDLNRLGEQLVQFKAKYPDLDLAQLDADKAFKKFIDGKLLGKKDFTKLYEEYVELKAEITGVELNVVRNNYQKAQSSSGSSIAPIETSGEIYSEEELRKISKRLPFMQQSEANQVEAKLKKSIAYYEGK